ncbi:hypothetical protein E8L99_04475 [Phreatobacter aquaticus]|uniref:Uncharacterized protein n=1 Tax=Phreatobacter aquaticus TaxID=2570229 RepID=A0A4D7QI45_9HYPH|nr:hypothetical protein [Phreatobacter aquaticus]QCK85086.1 hypothetical protein E8L99_04475 [Phreatobacter aquaticus]
MFDPTKVERLAKRMFLQERLAPLDWEQLSDLSRDSYRAQARHILFGEKIAAGWASQPLARVADAAVSVVR